jgi:[acyl-carrier-protein] S-malonyltransferase
MSKYQKIAFLFPGQGSQYPGMAKDFVKEFSAARMTFEEADDLLGYKIATIILKGPEQELTQTKNSQIGIFVASIAILRVIQELFEITPFVCAGLSLGEYTALTAGEYLSFQHCLPLVQLRGQFMNDACETTQGTMAVVLGLKADVVEQIVKKVNLPRDLWVANFNCPGQVVISGTVKGIEAGTAAALAAGAKRVLPLQVHGAFHSGLMRQAEERLADYVRHAPIAKGNCALVMNISGDFVTDNEKIKEDLIKQVTHPVRWEQGIRAMDREHVDLFIEFGPGRTLSGMNKRIGVKAPTVSIEKIEDLNSLTKELK